MNLVLSLMLRVAALSVACLVAASGWALWNTQRDQRAETERFLALAAQDVRAQLTRIAAGYDRWDNYPAIDALLETGTVAGLCLRYTDADERFAKSVCAGKDPGEALAPSWFAAVYGTLFRPGEELSREILWRGAARGRLVAEPDPDHAIAAAWEQVSAMVALAVLTVTALCAFLYVAIARALRPTGVMLAAFERLERGELAARVPRFDLVELQRMGAAFNRLADSLEKSVGERAALMHRLMTVQEEERHRLARELHDEFGQCLTGVAAHAAGIVQTAETDCPALVEAARRVADINGRMMEMLRGMLQRLRPPGLDELGLAGSVRSLVEQWPARRTRIELELAGEFDGLPEAVSVGVYRIVQECLTNVAKHAEATHVTVRLVRTRGTDGAAGDGIDVSVEDNGLADASAIPTSGGMGLLGMRERVAALGGQLLLQTRASKGLRVRALVPVVPA